MRDSAYSPLKVIHHRDKLFDLKRGIQPNPAHVQLIISDLCNQDCSFCAYRMSGYASAQTFATNTKLAKIGTNNPVRQIPYNKITEILNDCAVMGVGAIQLTGGGEPTVHPRFYQIVQAVLSRNMQLGLVTNGVLLHEASRKILQEAAWIRVSIDAGTPETYSSIRRISKEMYEKVWDNIWDMVKLKKAINSEVSIGLGFVVTKENWHEIMPFAAKAKKVGVDNIRFSAVFQNDEDAYFISFFEDAAQLCRDAELLADGGFAVFNNFGERVDDLRQHSPDYSFCGYENFTTYIGGDQNVYRCCGYSYNERGLIGSLKNQTFKKLWESEEKKEKFRSFDARGCERCQFNSKNRTILYAMEDEPQDVYFV